MRLGSWESDRERLRAAVPGVSIPPDLAAVVELERAGSAAEQDLERNRRLLARQPGAEAAMRPVAVAQHAARVAGNVETVRFRESPWVTVGGDD